MTTHPKLRAKNLEGKVIDIHSHAGVCLKAYGRMEYPYAQTIEGLFYQQLRGGVALNVVFPFSADLYFDMRQLMRGRAIKARHPVSAVPYQIENRMLMRELYDYCPELAPRFLPFISVDPARNVAGQLREVARLAGQYPIYGLKINPALCQSPVMALLDQGRCFLAFARDHNLPVLLHTSSMKADLYSFAGDAFRVIDKNPDIRFCLAHGILFSKTFLDRAQAASNVWVDTSALKIQVDLCRSAPGGLIDKSDLIDADFSDHAKVLQALCDQYPAIIVWGSDSPCYAYICKRRLTPKITQDFRYKGRYEDEVNALHHLPLSRQKLIASLNSARFLMGEKTKKNTKGADEQ